MVLAWFPMTSSRNPACYIRGLIHGIGGGVPNGRITVVNVLFLYFFVVYKLRLFHRELCNHSKQWPCLQNQFGPDQILIGDHGPDQIWLCKRYFSVPNIWSGPKSGPKRDLLMYKDHGPIEFGPVPNLDM